MKKLFLFFAAALMSVSMFAYDGPVPTDADLDFEQGKLTIAIHFSKVCGDVYFIGTYNNWNSSFDNCEKFKPVEGFDGWYQIQIEDESESIEGKPVHTTPDGAWSWDYQTGDADSWELIRGTVTIEPGYTGESNLKGYGTDAPVVLVSNAWKIDPCSIVYGNYHIVVDAPLCGGFAPMLIGAFDGWTGTPMIADEANFNYYLDITTTVGGEFKIVAVPLEGEYIWDNELQYFDEEEGSWEYFNNQVLPEGTDDPIVVNLDFSNESLYRWAKCADLEPKVGDQFIIDGVTYMISSIGSNNTVKVYWYDSNYSNSPVIPASVSYKDYTFVVTEIYGWSFANKANITSIVLPNTLITIGEGAFYGCTSLTSVTIPNSVTTIGEWAFGLVYNIVYNGTATGSPWGAKCVNGYVEGYLVYSDATKTTLCGCSTAATGEITVPNSVTTIGNYAFYNCTGLTSIVIGSSVAYIGESAFEYCENLSTVYNNSDLNIYAGSWNYGQVARYANKVYNGIPVGDFVIKRDTILTAYIGTATNVTIPNYITEIRYDAFYGCTGLTSVIIECTLSNGSSEVFRNCPISSVTIGEEVQYLPYGLFGYYEDEKHITSVTWNAKNCSTQYTSGSSIFGKQVKSFVFGNNVKVIPSNCCRDMTNLTSMVIPNSVDSVGSLAFYGCTGLTAPVYNANCFAFMPTSYIGAYIVTQGIKQIAGGAFYGCTGLTSVEIPNSATTIGEGAFYGCTSLTSVEIPNSVTSIGGEAFDGCTSITNITAPAIYFDVSEGLWLYHSKQFASVVVNGGELNENALQYINRSYKTLKTLDVSAVTNTEFADEAFEGCYNLESLILPQSLERIGYMMVAGCKNLKLIDIPASVVEIDQSAFEDCRSIKTITFNGNQLKTIGNWAFYNAHQLQNLTLPEGVEEIGEGAFYGCVYLENLVLPRTIKSIGDNGFSLCSKLSKITVHSVTPPTIEAKTFYEVNRQIPVYVPKEAVADYKQADYWKEFNIIGVETPTNLESIHGSHPTMHKYFHNGNLIIERNGIKYTATGQKVK